MIKLFIGMASISFLMGATQVFAEVAPTDKVAEKTTEKKVKYKQSKNLSFESHTVEGQIYRPDLSVVTGDTWLQENSILRMRRSWLDKVAIEYGEGNNDFNTK